MTNINELLSRALKNNIMNFEIVIQQKLIAYIDLISTWNRVFNLTNITEPQEMVYLHLIDSLIINPYLHGTRLLDVGSGAGLPGIPLAIINPDKQWTLLDKNSKKTRFLTQAVAELKLNNVQVVHSRCEEFQPDAKFDSILSRAFGTLRMFIEVNAHLLAPNGQFIAMKGKYPEDELQDLPANIVVNAVKKIDIKGMNIDRHIVILKSED